MDFDFQSEIAELKELQTKMSEQPRFEAGFAKSMLEVVQRIRSNATERSVYDLANTREKLTLIQEHLNEFLRTKSSQEANDRYGSLLGKIDELFFAVLGKEFR